MSVKPLLTEEEFKSLCNDKEEFVKTHGPRLQKYLVMKRFFFFFFFFIFLFLLGTHHYLLLVGLPTITCLTGGFALCI